MAHTQSNGYWPSVHVRVQNTFLEFGEEAGQQAESRRPRSGSCPLPAKRDHAEELAEPRWPTIEVLEHEVSDGELSPASTAASYRDVDWSRTGSKGRCVVSPPGALAGQQQPIEEGADDLATTLMVRNLPCRCTMDDILTDVHGLGFEGTYDFFYLPQDRRRKSNLGYAFINFKDPADAVDFQAQFQGRSFSAKGRNGQSQKVCEVTFAAIQGLERNREHFRKTAVKRNPNSSLYMVEPDMMIDRGYDRSCQNFRPTAPAAAVEPRGALERKFQPARRNYGQRDQNAARMPRCK